MQPRDKRFYPNSNLAIGCDHLLKGRDQTVWQDTFLRSCYNLKYYVSLRYLRVAIILVIVVSLVAWSLHLMQKALERREFSLMLAGFLVSAAAAGMVAVYFLMNHCLGYLQAAQHGDLTSLTADRVEWVLPQQEDWAAVWLDAGDRQFDRF